ncbi:MAG: hypothetical protein Q4E73_00380 [Lachnospiraceae bacterium]|nr:hypothetical protein [Lachnospiraceae bacterium]
MIRIAIPEICGEGLYVFYYLPKIILITVILIFGGILTIKNLKRPSAKAATTGILLATVGVYGAENLFTNYVCFELAGFLSVFWLTDKPDSHTNRSLKRYLGWLVITGMIMTMGMFLISHYAGTLVYGELKQNNLQSTWRYVALACYLIGYGSRGAVVMLHSWIDSVYKGDSLNKGILCSILLIPAGIWSLLQAFSALTFGYYQWKSVTEMMYAIGGITILLGLYRIWTCHEKGILFGNVSMVLSGSLLIKVFQVASLGQSVISFFIAYVLIVVLVYRVILKINWKPKHSFDLEWFSVENMLYEPLFAHALPFVFGIVFRLLDYLPDGIVALLRGTVYQDSKQKVWDKVGTPATYVLGSILDEIAFLLNKTVLRRHPIRKSFVNAAAVAKRESRATLEIVTRSVSFGLMMFSVGMMIVLIYIMV